MANAERYVNSLNYISIFKREQFFPKLSHRLPFNWKTPIGYMIALASEWAIIHSAILTAAIFVFFVGSAWLIICLIKDITNDLSELNITGTSLHSRRELRERFCYIIQFYSDAKQLSVALKTFDYANNINIYNIRTNHFLSSWNSIYFLHRFVDEFSQIYEFLLISFFLWSLLSIASSLLVILSQIV